MLFEFLQCRLNCGPVNLRLLLIIGFGDSIEVTLEFEALTRSLGTRDRTELRTIDSDPFSTDQTATSCEPYKFSSSSDDSLSMKTTKLGNALVVRVEASEHPHQFHIPATFSFQAARLTYLI